MRTMTFQQLKDLRENPVLLKIAESGRPDHSELKKEAAIFAKWIAREHAKERGVAKSVFA